MPQVHFLDWSPWHFSTDGVKDRNPSLPFYHLETALLISCVSAFSKKLFVLAPLEVGHIMFASEYSVSASQNKNIEVGI